MSTVEGGASGSRELVGRSLRAVCTAAVVGAAVVVLAVLAIVATGRWWQPSLRSADAAAVEPAPVAVDDTPAHHVLEQVLAADPPPAAAGTAGSGGRPTTTRHTDLDRCDPTAPALAAEQPAASGEHGPAAVAVEIYGAGLGQRVFDARVSAAARCGAWTVAVPGPGVAAAEGLQSGQWWVLWRRGDVIVRVSGAPDDAGELRRHALIIDAALQRELTPVCPDPAAPADAAVRNPGQADHRPLATAEPVTPPDDVAAPDASLLDGPLPNPDSESMRAAAVLTAPPPPPSVPLPGTVDVPVVDAVGPGCGWAFTGMVGPSTDDAELARQGDEARRAATDALRQRWSAWPDDVARWQRLRAAYLAQQRTRTIRPDTPAPTPDQAPVAPSDVPAPTTTTVPARPSPSTTTPSPSTTQPAPTTTTTSPSPSTTVAAAGTASG